MNRYQIAAKTALNPTVVMMDIFAPYVAAKAQPGQFIILRTDADGERIPLTVAGYDREKGLVRIIFQVVGATTKKLSGMSVGACLQDFAGPLGTPSRLDGLKRVCVVGGGVGCAIALPIAQTLHERGAEVTSIIGFRSEDMVILEKEFAAASARLTVTTDDGSYGLHGNTTQPLRALLEAGEAFDEVIAIGPLVMMKFVVETVRPYGIPCTVSMNPIMIDGTGMCGGCRLTVTENGRRVTRFACVDGPDFDGYSIDFDEAIQRGSMYRDFERGAMEHVCRLLDVKGE